MLSQTSMLLLLAILQSLGTPCPGYHDYCIVGAGPAGLQLGYFMARSGRDYVIFERAEAPGSFFQKYPRHRTLISINKRRTGKSNREHNLRHDWNSLLSHQEALLLPHYCQQMFPSADCLLRYLADFQQRLGIQVQYHTDIRNIRTRLNNSAPDGHVFHMEDQQNRTYTCRTLVLATGVSTPVVPGVDGIQHAVGYEELSTRPADYEGKRVLILGGGNSALETASSIHHVTSSLHIASRSRLRFSWATHYVGDIRAVNNSPLESYQLLSLDMVRRLELDANTAIVPLPGAKLAVTDTRHPPLQALLSRPVSTQLSQAYSAYSVLGQPYDLIIRCLGFAFNYSLFANSSIITTTHGKGEKYPAIRHNYESEVTPGLFVAGTASHSLDFRRSAGGFIHGFRYTVRALHRLLERGYEGRDWPSLHAPTPQLLPHLLRRLNEASGLYQMSGVLGDVIAISSDGWEFEYFEEVPVNLLHCLEKSTGIRGGSYLVMTLEYGKNFSGAHQDVFRRGRVTGPASKGHRANFLHPVLYFYRQLPTEKDFARLPGNQTLPRPDFLHHVVENFLIEWTHPINHLLPLRRFLEHVTQVDVRDFFAHVCFRLALTHTSLPLGCRMYIQGQGLPGTSSVLKAARVAGLLW